MNKIRIACRTVLFLANEAARVVEDLFLGNDRLTAPPAEGLHYVQLSPFGDFGNSNGGKKVIQRFTHEDGQTIANAFNKGMGKTKGQPLGMPFYIGHPDHPAFKGQPGHTDVAAKGRGVKMEVRYDANCAACNAFANAAGDKEAEPCAEHGLFVGVEWNKDGLEIVNSKQFHGHSVNWGCVPDGVENGRSVFRPVKVKSAGFTNEPNIPVKPASLANAESAPDGMALKISAPPYIKLAAGFKADEEKSIEECEAALKKNPPVLAGDKSTANEAIEAVADCLLLCNAKDDEDGKAFEASLHTKLGTDPKGGRDAIMAALEKKLPDADAVSKVREARKAAAKAQAAHGDAYNKLEQQMSNSKAIAAKSIVHVLIKLDRVNIKAAPSAVTQFVNADPEKWEEMANSFARPGSVTGNLSRANYLPVEGERERQQRLQQLLDARHKAAPAETYDERFRFVANSTEGKPLFDQMKRAGADADDNE
jgi:hypothetical protein